MKASFSITALITLLVASAAAKNCKPGLHYCGSTLMKIGKYQQQLSQAIIEAKQTVSVQNAHNGLLLCDGGVDGSVAWVQGCPGLCVNGGTDMDDYCQ